VIRRNLLAACAAAALASTLAAGAGAQGRAYKIIGVGDIMMGSDYPQPIMDPRVTPGADPAAMLGAPLARLLKEADVTFGNYEGTMHALNSGAKLCRNPTQCYVFRSPPFHAEVLRRVGFNLMSTANNHAGDFGDAGRTATYDSLRRAGIAVAGPDKDGQRTAVLRLADGTRIGLAAFGHNPGIPWLTDIPRAQQIVRELRRQSDIVIVSFHGGAEGGAVLRVPRQTEIFLNENRGDVYRFSHAVVDAGAHIVFGHGPHVPRAADVYKGAFIIYSLGNFWTYGRFNLKGPNGIAPVAEVNIDKLGRIMSARLHSVMQDHPGGPRMDPDSGAARLVAQLTAQDFPEVRAQFLPDGRIIAPGIGTRQ
jgi:poly-gamma-glutamate capsule biosynthesis protein CapA/YwtB (metallophosphatase superfamily)